MRFALLVAVAVAVAVLVGACAPDAGERAAVAAQDACIAALQPVADGRTPGAAELAQAQRHADDAAEGDERWRALRDLLAALSQRPDDRQAVDAVADECRRANDAVRERT